MTLGIKNTQFEIDPNTNFKKLNAQEAFKKRYDLIVPDELRIDKMESRPEKYHPEFGREE